MKKLLIKLKHKAAENRRLGGKIQDFSGGYLKLDSLLLISSIEGWQTWNIDGISVLQEFFGGFQKRISFVLFPSFFKEFFFFLFLSFSSSWVWTTISCLRGEEGGERRILSCVEGKGLGPYPIAGVGKGHGGGLRRRIVFFQQICSAKVVVEK